MRFAAEALPISVPTVLRVRGATVARVVVARVASTRRWIECILEVQRELEERRGKRRSSGEEECCSVVPLDL